MMAVTLLMLGRDRDNSVGLKEPCLYTVYVRYFCSILGNIFGRTKHTVVHNVKTRFWPTLRICHIFKMLRRAIAKHSLSHLLTAQSHHRDMTVKLLLLRRATVTHLLSHA